MSRLELRAFSEDDLDGAGALLAARHRAHRAAEPLLSARYEDSDAARAEVAALWGEEHASGAVALRDGQTAGFLLGTRKQDDMWGANVWVEAAGYAAVEPEVVRDLYAFASQRWVDEGRTRHYALVPYLDDQVDAWFRLSFGAQHAHGVKEVAAGVWPPGARLAEPGDVDAMAELAPVIWEHQTLAPVFSGLEWNEDPDDLLRVLAAEIVNDEVGELVYERGRANRRQLRARPGRDGLARTAASRRPTAPRASASRRAGRTSAARAPVSP